MSSTSQLNLNIKIFADGADKHQILSLYQKPFIKGFTTNPTLMRQAGVVNYKRFAKEILTLITDRPISFEVFADDFRTMYVQALEIASWADNVYVKIPVTNTLGESSIDLVHELANEGVKLNVTALMTLQQVTEVSTAIGDEVPANISVFAGRIADTGVDPVPLMAEAIRIMQHYPKQELIWASPREVLNVIQANNIGCHIITVTPDVLKKLDLLGKCLTEFSLETVKMFRRDALAAGYSLEDTNTEAAA